MNIKTAIITTMSVMALLFASCSTKALYKEFYNSMDNAEAMSRAIERIRHSGDQSADRYVAEFNYYVNTALIHSGMTTSTQFPSSNENVEGEIYTLTDSTGTVAGYMYFTQIWDSLKADSALAVIDQGIALHPDRLDMRYGKIHFCGELCRWQAFADAIHATLDHTVAINKRWIFPDADAPVDTVLVEVMLNYESRLFDAVTNARDSVSAMANLARFRGVVEHMLRLYPDNLYNLNLMAVSHQLTGNHAEALSWLLMAEKVDPRDGIVLSNIADTYHLLGDIANERIYLQKLLEVGDADLKARARQNLDELDKINQ